jgi:UDP-N-acetylglucosamine acyltransferase
LQRRGFSEEVRVQIKRAYRIFFQSQLNVSQAVERVRDELPASPELETFLSFVEESERGILV